MSDIADQLLTRHSPLALLGHVDEFNILDPRSIVGLFWIMAVKTVKNPYRLKVLTFRKPKYEKEKTKIMYSVALVMAFLSAENENQQLTDLPQAWKISSDGSYQCNHWEFCIMQIGLIVCFCSDSTYVFIVSALTHFTILYGVSILTFIFIDMVDFSCQ